MSDTQRCPGCPATKPASDLCCDACWERLPAKLGGRTWKRARINARQRRAWGVVETYNGLIRGWLVEHRLH